MDYLTKNELELLIEGTSGKTLSIYIPTEKVGREAEEGRIHLKNALKEAEEMLENAGKSPQTIDRFLKGALNLTNDSIFWQHQSEGLALFIDNEGMETYRLPIKFESFVDYGDVPYIKPLFPLFVENKTFYVLALSQKNIRLIHCTHYNATEVPLNEIPVSLEEYKTFEDPNSGKTYERNNKQMDNRQAAGYVGHGVDAIDEKAQMGRFFHEVDHGIGDLIDDPTAPIILAGVEFLTSIYRDITTLNAVLEETLTGNPDNRSGEELRDKGWPIIADLQRQHFDRILDRYGVLDQKEQALSDLKAIAPAAINGRIDTLVLAKDLHLWGDFEYETQEVNTFDEKQGIDLANFSALHTFMSGGTIYVVDRERLPDSEDCLALLRY